MSKNFVRGIDHIYNINKQEFYTNKPNDLLSTKEHNYIRKETREYHCLTDNVKQTKATNVKYTDTTASPNVNYNLISVDNSQVPKTNTNTISASSLVSALEAKDQQIKELKDEIALFGGKVPQIVFYNSYPTNNDGLYEGGEALVCDTILSELDDSDDGTYIIDCLLTLTNVTTTFTNENRVLNFEPYKPYRNFNFNEYDLRVFVDVPKSEINSITFTADRISIDFGTSAKFPYTGTIPFEVRMTPKS